MMQNLNQLLEQTAALHHHLCPRQVLGVRMGLYAAELLGVSVPCEDKRLYAFVETDGCFADGVAVATGCWLGHRTMRLMDYGKVAVTVVDAETEEAVRVWPHPQARAHAAALMPDAQSRWHAQLNAYQLLCTDKLLCAEQVSLNLSLRKLVSRPGLRVSCSICGEEILNEREVPVGEQMLCKSCADGGYYQLAQASERFARE